MRSEEDYPADSPIPAEDGADIALAARLSSFKKTSDNG